MPMRLDERNAQLKWGGDAPPPRPPPPIGDRLGGSRGTRAARRTRSGPCSSALYRAVIVRMRFHQPTRDYVARRIAAGRTKRDIIRCLKRFLAREIYQRVMADFRTRQAITRAA